MFPDFGGHDGKAREVGHAHVFFALESTARQQITRATGKVKKGGGGPAGFNSDGRRHTPGEGQRLFGAHVHEGAPLQH